MASETLKQIQSVLGDFSKPAAENKIFLLNKMNGEKLSASELKNYHDKLLFLSAYADNQAVYKAADSELSGISRRIGKSVRLQSGLLNSGIVFSPAQSTYTFTLTKWLCRNFPGTISFHSFDEGAPHPKEIFKHLLPKEEFELLYDDTLKPLKWLERASGTNNSKNQINWIVDCFDSNSIPLPIKEQLFENLKVYIEISSDSVLFSRSFGKISVKNFFYHAEPLLKKFGERELITRALPSETKLSGEQKKEIISVTRISLCLLQRETDPVTYSEHHNIKYFELERGLSIALFSIDQEMRMPLESYIGFMMFKNGYPMSYGGAWLFGKRALIGINIFEAYRGGESAVVFALLLRTYHKAFGADYFEVEPYQFGKNNPEGIKSGAFWFYFRFGFRPVNDTLHKLSLDEQRKIKSEKNYRSSFETLKKFTKSNLILNLAGDSVPLNPSDLSRFITIKINKDFNGNRQYALLAAQRILRKERILDNESKPGVSMLGMFVAFCLDLDSMKAKDKTLLRKLIIAKAGDEFDYIFKLNHFQFSEHLNNSTRNYLGISGSSV